jgi:hypothetical protein
MKKEINITYIKEWALTEGIYSPIHGYKKVGTLFTKHYHNAIFLLAGLNSSSRDLLEFLIQRMDGANVVLSNTKVREDFIALIDKATNGDTTYTHNTVKKAYQTLVKKNLILARKQRGSYTVNPEYFFKRDEKDRIQQIKLILENK